MDAKVVTAPVELLPCPFCGARPHQGLGKIQHCSLHGEPFQRFHIKCPKLHAEISAPDRERAIAAWNTRHCPDPVSAAEGDLLGRFVEALADADAEIRALRNWIDTFPSKAIAPDDWGKLHKPLVTKNTLKNIDAILSQVREVK